MAVLINYNHSHPLKYSWHHNASLSKLPSFIIHRTDMRYARTASLVASLAAGVSSLSINITAGLPGFSSCPSFNESLPDYNCYPDCLAPSISPSEPISFGSHYTILNVDMISAVAGGIVKTPPGCKWIQNNQDWMGAVHSQTPAPLSIWTRIYHASARKPEITTNTPWAGEAGMLGDSSDPLTQIYSEFKPDPVNDVVLGKSRYYAGSGNSLETILEAQGIDTVIFSGIRTSGALLTTMYRFFDLDYKV